MNPPPVPENPKVETWGAFLKYALPLGVSIEWMEPCEFPDRKAPGFFYLRLESESGVRSVPVPDGDRFTMDRPMRLRRMENVCELLGIPCARPWPVTL